MPLFIDIHEVAGATVEQIADAHVKDVSVQDVLAVQQIFGGETIRLVHLALAKGFFHNTLRISAGRLNALDDFIASPLSCNAQNLGLCGTALGIPFDVNISSYPNMRRLLEIEQ